MSCVVERHLLQTVPALRNLTTAEQMPAVCPLLPVLWYSSPYTTRVTADTTPWCPPEEGLCSGQNGKAKPNWDVMGWGRAERSRTEQKAAGSAGRNQTGCAGWKRCSEAGFGAVRKRHRTCPRVRHPAGGSVSRGVRGSRPAFFQHGPTRGHGEWAAVPRSCSSISSLFSVLGWCSPGIALGWYTLVLSTFLSI